MVESREFGFGGFADELRARVALKLPNELELKQMAKESILGTESHGLTVENVIDEGFIDKDGKGLKPLAAMYKYVVENYGGEKSLLATKVEEIVTQNMTVCVASDDYKQAQLAIVLLVQKVRAVKSGSWVAIMEKK